MKKKLAFIGLVSCILVLLIGATTVSAAPPDRIDVTAGEGAVLTPDILGDGGSPATILITIPQRITPMGFPTQILIHPGSHAVGP